MQGNISARCWTIELLLECITPPRFIFWVHHADRSLVGSCKSKLRTTFPIKLSCRFAILFWEVGMLKNLPLTSALVILSSFTYDIFIPKILLTLLCRNTSSLERRDARSDQLSLPQRSILYGIAIKIRYLYFRSTDVLPQ